MERKKQLAIWCITGVPSGSERTPQEYLENISEKHLRHALGIHQSERNGVAPEQRSLYRESSRVADLLYGCGSLCREIILSVCLCIKLYLSLCLSIITPFPIPWGRSDIYSLRNITHARPKPVASEFN